MLVGAGMLTAERLTQALALQKQHGKRVGEILVEQGFVTEGQLTQTLSNQLSVPWVSLYHVDFTRALLNYVPRELAERWCLVPVYVRAVRREGDTLFVAMDDPTNEEAIAAVAAAAVLPVKPMVAAPSEIRNVIRVYYGGGREAPRTSMPGYAPPRASMPTPAPAERAAVGAAASAVVAQVPVAASATASAAASASAPATATAAESASASAPATVSPSAPAPAAAAEPASAAAPATAARMTPAAGTTRTAKKPRMISITLLDGTSVSLPAPGDKRVVESGAATVDGAEDALTASDLVAALRAKAAGADVTDVLGNATWESMFAALLSVLLKKHLIADWEFVEEWKKHKR